MRRTAVLIALLGLTIAYVAGQTSDFALRRFGSVKIRDAEVAQIIELVAAPGHRPWLLHSPQTLQNARHARVFLEPDVAGSQVLRGRTLDVGADDPPDVPLRSPWRIRESFSYVYVPIPGRQLGEVRHEYDAGWPFFVEGELDDETLVSVVEFIRSRPPVPGWEPTAQVSQAPISSILRRGAEVFVNLRTGELRTEQATLIRSAGKWVITRFGRGIV